MAVRAGDESAGRHGISARPRLAGSSRRTRRQRTECETTLIASARGVPSPGVARDGFARLAGLRSAAEVPLLVYGATMVCLWLMTAVAGYDFLDDVTWIHWDSGLYLSIATDGYRLVQCSPPYPPGLGCGNTGWFPLYSWIVGGLYQVGLPIGATAIVVSNLFVIGQLIVVWVGFLGRRATPTAILALAFVAFVPGAIYHHAVFPMSTLGFFTLLCLALCRAERWTAAGLAGAAAAASYPLGVLVVPALAIWVWVVYRGLSVRQRVSRTLSTAGIAVLGAVSVVAVQWAQTGHWDAFWKAQDKYNPGVHSPFSAYWDRVDVLFSDPRGLSALLAAQTVFVGVAVVVTLVSLAVRRDWADRSDVLVALVVILYWVVPLTQRGQSIWRAESALVPLALLLRFVPLRLGVPLLAIAVTCGLLLPPFFFNNQLV